MYLELDQRQQAMLQLCEWSTILLPKVPLILRVCAVETILNYTLRHMVHCVVLELLNYRRNMLYHDLDGP